MAKNSWIVRCFDSFDNHTLGYRFFDSELPAKKFAKRFDDADHYGNGYAVYPRLCWIRGEKETPDAEYPITEFEFSGSFSEMQKKFREVIKEEDVFYARLDPWFDFNMQQEMEYSYCREIRI